MTLRRHILVICILLAATGAVRPEMSLGQETTQTPLEILRSKAPGAMWDEGISVRADVTCDGVADVVMVGHETNVAWIGVVPGLSSEQSEPIASSFPIGTHSQGSFCSKPVKIEAYPITCEDEDGALPGCQPVKDCQAFSVIDDACDSFHFYWDSDQKRLTWWRR